MGNAVKINSASIVVWSDEQVSAELDGETIIMSIHDGNYYNLNPVARTIWELIEIPTSIGSICEKLRESFDVEERQCELEVIDILEELFENGLINVEEDSA